MTSETKSTLFFFDTETTGLPDWKSPSESEHQPHIVQLAAELVDPDTREVIESMDVIVKPEGWEITAEMTAIHGITYEHALAVGIPEADALNMARAMRVRAARRIAHNRTFDDRILRIAAKRYLDNPNAAEGEAQPSDEWKGSEGGYCTCQQAKKALGLKKLPTMQEAHLALVGAEFEGAHSAMADVRACRAVYFAIQDRATALATK